MSVFKIKVNIRMGKDADSKAFDPLILKGIKNFQAGNKFKNVVLSSLLDTLSEDDVKVVREQFTKMDTDGSGQVEITELAKIFHDLKDEAVEEIMKSMDTDGDGKISLSEFSQAFLNRKVPTSIRSN